MENKFIRADEVAKELSVSVPYAYKLIRRLNEELKAQDQMLWVQRMNNIRNRAMEVVNDDLIYA